MLKPSFLLLTLLVTGSACEAPTGPGDGDNLATARALWTAKSGPVYSYTADRSCECLLGGRPMTVTVVRGSVTSAQYVSGSPVDHALLTYVLTVPDLFDLIQDALDRKAAYLAVTYDPTYGFPTRIQVDYSANAVDDETTLTMRDVTFSAVE